MMRGPLCAAENAGHWHHAATVLLDCRFNLGEPGAGRAAYFEGHIPGAHYAHLDEQLSSPMTSASGRHPLPDPAVWCSQLGAWGITPDTQVVVYDDAGGMFAARCWWLLKWVGHTDVAVLDGGLTAWLKAGSSLTTVLPTHEPTDAYPGTPQSHTVVDADTLLANMQAPKFALVDARAPGRFVGAEEPIDTVAGHIPGALNRPVTANLTEAGIFKSPADLRDEWTALLGEQDCVAMCGSGVTACHHLLALAVADLPAGRLYPGSWSEWIRDPTRPVNTG